MRFSQWTEEGRLRAPVFEGVRPEVDPRSVRRESADSASSLSLVGPMAQETELQEVLEHLSDTRDEALTLRVGDCRVNLTNLNKELWPAADGRPAVTKRDMIRYYSRGWAHPLTPPAGPSPDADPLPQRHPQGQLLPEALEPDPAGVRRHGEALLVPQRGDSEYIVVNKPCDQSYGWQQLANIEFIRGCREPFGSRTRGISPPTSPAATRA